MLLIVLLMLLVATGSALYAMQATFYEQGASTSYADAAWTRSLAEGAAMSGLAVVEENGIPRASLTENLDLRWRDQGNPRSDFSIKYGMPTPLQGTTGAPADPDAARSFENRVDTNAFMVTMPQGLLGFCDPPRDGQVPYGAPFAARHYRTGNCRVIYETWGGLGSGSSSTAVGVGTLVRPRTRSVITGIGETAPPGDVGSLTNPADVVGGQRGLHETVGMSRAYFDRLN